MKKQLLFTAVALAVASTQANALKVSHTDSINKTLLAGESKDIKINIAEITKRELSSGKYLINGAYLRLNANQNAYLKSQPDNIQKTGKVFNPNGPRSWTINYEIPAQELTVDGVKKKFYSNGYPINNCSSPVSSYSCTTYTEYNNVKNSATGKITLGSKSSSLLFGTGYSTSNHSTTKFVEPKGSDVLLRRNYADATKVNSRYTYDGFYLGSLPHNHTYSYTFHNNMFKETDKDGNFLINLAVTSGKIHFSSYSLYIDYELNPNWVASEIDKVNNKVDTINEVPVPAAAWLFGTALLGLTAVKRKS